MPVDKDSWQTPPYLFNGLNEEFRFGLDAAASHENTLVPYRYYTKEDDALSKPWDVPTFCNPPYSKEAGGIMRWVEYGAWQASRYKVPVVMVVPGDTSTSYRQYAMMYAIEIRDLTHRVKFVGAPTTPTFPTAIYIFKPQGYRVTKECTVSLYDYRRV